jgi:CheY-like chemotaxis protein
VDSADQGIAIATRERPDLILMDIRLKGKKDGVQPADEIRRQMDVSIVYVTALSDQSTVEHARATDHDGFILKPFQQREPQSTIEVAMLRRTVGARKPIQ